MSCGKHYTMSYFCQKSEVAQSTTLPYCIAYAFLPEDCDTLWLLT